jgi:hypothetical protein
VYLLSDINYHGIRGLFSVYGMRCAHVKPGNARRALPDLPVAEVCQPVHVCFAFAGVKRIQRHLGGGFGTGLALHELPFVGWAADALIGDAGIVECLLLEGGLDLLYRALLDCLGDGVKRSWEKVRTALWSMVTSSSVHFALALPLVCCAPCSSIVSSPSLAKASLAEANISPTFPELVILLLWQHQNNLL